MTVHSLIDKVERVKINGTEYECYFYHRILGNLSHQKRADLPERYIFTVLLFDKF